MDVLELPDYLIFRFKDDPKFRYGLLAAIIIIIALAFLSFSQQPNSGLSGCGDGDCDSAAGEGIFSCSRDCAPSEGELYIITVTITSRIPSEIEVRLEDSGGSTLKSSAGATSQFTFAGISPGRVRAVAMNSLNGKTAESSFISVGQGEKAITLTLPQGFFDPSAQQKATLKVRVLDSSMLSPVSAKVSLLEANGQSFLPRETRDVPGISYFTVDANLWYSIVAEEPGYSPFDTKGSPIMMEQGAEREIVALMQLLSQPPAPAALRVCVTDQDSKPVNGLVELRDRFYEELAERPLSGGCADFELAAQTVTISLTGLPGNCAANSTELQLNGGQNQAAITTICGGAAHIRAKLVAENGTILTQSASITALYEDGSKAAGSRPDQNLAMGLNGYTEFISTIPGKPVYFHLYGLLGYGTYDSEPYSLEPGENRSIQITMVRPSPALPFSFSGISFPSYVGVNSSFNASIGQITYGQTIVTSQANLSVSFAGRPCNVTGLRASCAAPIAPGTYDLAFIARYLDKTGSEAKNLSVVAAGPGSLFSITQYFSFDDEPPIAFDFEIKFNSTLLDYLDNSSASVYYTSGGIPAGTTALTGSNGLYSMTVNSPYPGEHRAEMHLEKVRGGTLYQQNYSVYFDSHPASLAFVPQSSAVPKIVEPGATFALYASLKKGGGEVQGLTNIFASLFGEKHPLYWSGPLHAYAGSFAASLREGIYPISMRIGNRDIAEETIYVIDTTKAKSSACPIADCKSVPEVRRCVYRHKNENMYSEADVIECIESGWTVSGINVAHCESLSANRGDWDNNCSLAQNDVSIMDDMLLHITDQQERNSYAGCGDMDNDRDVDQDDKTCMSKVASGAWDGDLGGSCFAQMKGGYCFNITKDLPGDYNGDETINSADKIIMRNIVVASGAGVTPSAELLSVSDFDGNGIINDADMACLESIMGQGNISTGCLAAYGFGCSGMHGDLASDGVYNEADLLLESWAIRGRIDLYADPTGSAAFECADVNDDGSITSNDYECLSAMVTDDEGGKELFCNPCQLQRQREGRYGQEICNDGVDNDCDNRADFQDPRCSCGPQTPCSMLYDSDGIVSTTGIDSYKLCRSFNERNFGDTENGSHIEDTDAAVELKSDDDSWGWHSLEEIYGQCGESSDWGDTMSCGGSTATCLYKYHAGFSMRPDVAQSRLGDAYDAETANKFLFEWLLAAANVGPLGVLHDFGGYPQCPEDWRGVGNLHFKYGGHHYFTFCRYVYDVCAPPHCEDSGASLPDSLYNGQADWSLEFTEVCPAKHICFGTIDDSPEGIGRFDRTYPGFTWIPTSGEAGGMLRVIVPNSIGGAAPLRVYISKDPLAHFGVVEEGAPIGGSEYAFGKTGIEYGACYLIAEYPDGSKKAYWIKSGATWYYVGGTVRF